MPLESQGLTEALVRERRALQQISPAYFRYYMAAVGQAKFPASHGSRHAGNQRPED